MPDATATHVHVFPLRVYYEDTDAAGIVYYANYLRFAERARTEMLRVRGVESGALMEGDGVAFAVRHCEVDYIKPARLDDALEIRSSVIELAGASVRMRQDVCRDGDLLVSMTVRLACMNVHTGAVARMPMAVRTVLREMN